MSKALRESNMLDRARSGLTHPVLGAMKEGGAFLLFMDTKEYLRVGILDASRTEIIKIIMRNVGIPTDRILEHVVLPAYRCNKCGTFRQDSDFPRIRKPGLYGCMDIGKRKCTGHLVELKVKTVPGFEGFNPTLAP